MKYARLSRRVNVHVVFITICVRLDDFVHSTRRHAGGRMQDKKALSLPITPTSTPPMKRGSISQHPRRSTDVGLIGDIINEVLPITKNPSEKMFRAGWVLRTIILSHCSQMIRDRKIHMKVYHDSLVGTEMVDWILDAGKNAHILSRPQAVGIWQSLLEEGVIAHVTQEYQFKDKNLFYRFCIDEEGNAAPLTERDVIAAEEELTDVLVMIAQKGPDAMLRMILRKKPEERSEEDMEIVNEELSHLKALSHLSSSVKKELASVFVFESHLHKDTVLFNQGDEGKSWYIIVKGSVNVVIYGKGVVTSLKEGDDFGKLALINDAPRAASIVLREDNCHFLRVDKNDFNRILRDVEANTVRLKEHGKDVLVLEKIRPNSAADRGSNRYKYSVMAGTPQKMLEYLLEARMDNKLEDIQDSFVEDFLLTHVIFMPSQLLCTELIRQYPLHQSTEIEFMISSKRRVIQFVRYWVDVIHEPLFEDPNVEDFVNDLYEMVREDDENYGTFDEELRIIAQVHEEKQRYFDREQQKLVHKWKVSSGGQIVKLSEETQDPDRFERHMPMKSKDEIIFRLYCADHTYNTMKMSVGATAEMVKKAAAEKTGLSGEVVLVEVKSNGEKVVFNEAATSLPTILSVNGKIFIAPTENVETLTPVREQDGPTQSSIQTLEVLGSRELAFELTLYDWDLFSCIHEVNPVVDPGSVSGMRCKYAQMVASPWGEDREHFCREYKNMNAFFAIIMGLSNIAVSKMASTWDKLNSKVRRTFTEFEAIIDPSRNHRAYRLTVAKMSPPIIPFMPLIMKDMTFTHEGNKTTNGGLVNFEKMVSSSYWKYL
ncbi:Rap guanine nucleotide exchange factor 4 [Nymphon striatum]|nr:Rap guanine nucleotide exchange factor 4 [Nymphon striatum]